MKKHVFSALLSLCMVLALSLSVMASAKSDIKYCTSSADVAEVVYEGYNQDKQGPVQIAEGKYTSNAGNTFDVYVVFVSGTENEVLWASNNGFSLDMAAINLKNSPYYYHIKSIIRNNIPKGSRIILVGHSLGGMMTQQLATDDTLKDEYIIKYDLCYGAPLTQMNDEREGGLQRLGDWFDPIPFETANILTNTKEAVTYSRENGGYYIDVYNAHMSSYDDADTWGDYDVTGKKGGKATLALDMSTRTFYKSDYTLIIDELIADLS